MAADVAQPDIGSGDRLTFTLFIAVVMHAAIILGISFSQELPSNISPTIEITLAQHKSDQAPEKADYLAQHNQQASGTLEEKALLTTTQQAQFDDTIIRDIAPTPQQQAQSEVAKTDKTLLTSRDSLQKINIQKSPTPEEEREKRQGELTTIRDRSAEIASMQAKLDRQRQSYARRPRIHRLTSLATKSASDAEYLHHWRERIEQIGNKNYPEAARSAEIFGSLRLMVSLNPNGTVYEMKVLKSSGHKVLDDAALRIVRLAAPFPPFPPEISKSVDRLEIIRTWRFHKDQRLTSS